MSWATWLLFTGVLPPRVVLHVQCPGPLGSCSPVCPLVVSCRSCGVLDQLAPVHRCALSVRGVACAVPWATWLLISGVLARCVVLRVRCPGPLGSCSPVCLPGASSCMCGVLGHLTPVHWCARSVRCVVCAVSCATLLLFTAVPAQCVVLRVWCPGPLGSCSPVCSLGVLCCLCGVLGHLACVHRCARSVRCVACAVSWTTWLLSTSVPARCVVSLVRCPGPVGSCSPVWSLGAWCCVCGPLGQLAPDLRCARSVRCVVCAVSRATWLLFTGVPGRCVVLRVRCPGPLGSCSPMCSPGVLRHVYGVLGDLAPVHRCACSVRGVARAVPWATWLSFSGVLAWCVVLRVWCAGSLGCCSPLCSLGALRCVCGVLGHLTPVHPCACLVCCVARAVSRTTWLLFTGVLAPRVVLRVRCPGHLGPVHRRARSVRCVACAVSWATWLLFTGVLARCVVLRVRSPGPLGSRSPVCSLGAWCCVCGPLGHLALVLRCARSVRCVACVVSRVTWLLFTAVLARCVSLCVRCPGPLGSCSPMCLLGVLCCVCRVPDHLTPVHRCARSVRCVACAVSWPLGCCSPVCPLGALCRLCGVLDHLAPVHQCARSLCRVACAVSWATWFLFTGVLARCVVLRVRTPGPVGS